MEMSADWGSSEVMRTAELGMGRKARVTKRVEIIR